MNRFLNFHTDWHGEFNTCPDVVFKVYSMRHEYIHLTVFMCNCFITTNTEYTGDKIENKLSTLLNRPISI